MTTATAKKLAMQTEVQGTGVEMGVWSRPKGNATSLSVAGTVADLISLIQGAQNEVAERSAKVNVEIRSVSAVISTDVLNESVD